MQESHMNPQEAVRAHLDLKSKKSIGIHFGTWKLTDEGIEDPILSLREAVKTNSLKEEDFVAPFNGQVFEIAL